ncbi:MAG TPA: hypothetical protein VF316_25355 [Polyangiaceae bacterium]
MQLTHADNPTVYRLLVSTALRALTKAGTRGSYHRWPDLVVVLRSGETEVMSRAAFASFLRDNGLETKAHECLARKVERGRILTWIEGETYGVEGSFAVADFLLLDPSAVSRGR